jgi:hypothetical protein
MGEECGEHRGGAERTRRGVGEDILFPTQAFNLIRFNGIRQLPISAPHMGHPDKNPPSLINRRR